MGNGKGSPSRFSAQRSSFQPDPYPYSLIVRRPFGDGTERIYGYLAASALKWRMQQQNQRATRFSTGDRQLADMSLLNVMSWRDLHRGGTGASTASDSTRYRYSRGIFCGDDDEIKLQPILNDVPVSWTAGTPEPGFPIRAMMWAVLPNSHGVGNMWLCTSPNPPTVNATTGIKWWSLYAGRTTPELVSWNWLQSGQFYNVMTGQSIGTATVHKGRIYFTAYQVASGVGNWGIFKLHHIAPVGWHMDICTASVTTGPHFVYSDGVYLYRATDDQVSRSADPESVNGGTWSAPVVLGDGRPITAMQSYGDANERGLYVTTSNGLYRILDEVPPASTTGATVMSRAYPVDIQPGASDQYYGQHLDVARGELVWNYPKGLLRHTLGSTEFTSPFEDNGHPAAYRGQMGPLQDGITGVMVACNPVAGENVTAPTLYRWQEGRWHEFMLLDEQMLRVRNLAWLPSSYAGFNRLLVAWDTKTDQQARLSWMDWPRTSLKYNDLAGTLIRMSGTLFFPRWTGEFPELDKVIAEAVVEATANHPVGCGGITLTVTQDDYGTGGGGQQVAVTYSSVPTLTDPTKTTWVPDRSRVEMTGKAFNTQLDITRSVGAAYTSAGMEPRAMWELPNIGIFMFGVGQPGQSGGVEAPLRNGALKYWSERTWKRVPVLCDHVALVFSTGGSWVVAFGVFYNDAGKQFGVISYEMAGNYVAFYEGWAGATVAQAAGDATDGICITTDHRVLTWGVELEGWYRGTLWASINSNLRIEKWAPRQYIAIGGWMHWNNDPQGYYCIWFDNNAYDFRFYPAQMPGGFTNMCTWVTRVMWSGTEMFVSGGSQVCYFPGGVHQPTPTNMANPGWGDWVYSMDKLGNNMVVAGKNGVWQYSFLAGHGVWTAIVDGGPAPIVVRLSRHGGCLSYILFGEPGAANFYYGSYSNVRRMNVRQLGLSNYLPVWGAAVPNVSPVVRAVALKHLEVAPFLRQYTVECELAEGLVLRNGEQVKISVEQQYDELLELAACNEICTIIVEPGHAIRGVIGGLQMSTDVESRDLKRGVVVKRSLLVAFSVTEVIPSSSSTVPFVRPEQKYAWGADVVPLVLGVEPNDGQTTEQQAEATGTASTLGADAAANEDSELPTADGRSTAAEHREPGVSAECGERDTVGADSGEVG